MSYTPPTTFVDGTVLTGAALEGNYSALRVYLHGGIVAGDLAAVQWIDSRHVQPPLYDAFTGVQHGVTGHQGAQWSGGTAINLTFITKYLTGQGAQGGGSSWHHVPNTSFSLDIRRPARCIYHWHAEIEVGPDATPSGQQVVTEDRHVWVAPYRRITNELDSDVSRYDLQMGSQSPDTSPWATPSTITPIGTPDGVYTNTGRYSQRSGVMVYDATSAGEQTFGLAAFSRVDRSAVVNWSAAIEIYYL
jgi:hypothetical protein